MRELMPDETLEDLERAGLFLIQKKKGFRFGEDTVLLSHFVASFAGRKKRPLLGLELGTNCGAASILLAGRRKDVLIDGIEIDEAAAEVFSRNIQMNGLKERLFSYCMDIRAWPPSDKKNAAYDFVFFNPPYREIDRGEVTQKEGGEALLAARFFIHGGLEDFIKTAKNALVPEGHLFFVMRATRIDESIAYLMKHSLYPEKLRFVHPNEKKEATLFLMSAKKGKNPGNVRLLPPLFLYDDQKNKSKELREIYEKEDAPCSIL